MGGFQTIPSHGVYGFGWIPTKISYGKSISRLQSGHHFWNLWGSIITYSACMSVCEKAQQWQQPGTKRPPREVRRCAIKGAMVRGELCELPWKRRMVMRSILMRIYIIPILFGFPCVPCNLIMAHICSNCFRNRKAWQKLCFHCYPILSHTPVPALHFDGRFCSFWHWSMKNLFCGFICMLEPARQIISSYILATGEWTITGWWWLEHEFYDFPYNGNFIIPTDFHSIIFQRGWLKPPTR